MDALPIFLRQVRSRSKKHQRAMAVLERERLSGQMVAVLRQELDSMVGIIYLLTQSAERRGLLVEASVRGDKWSQPNLSASVTDREMVGLAQNLQGWARSVYKFGCAFIHLSVLHDYNGRDPLEQLPAQEREDMLDHCRNYHGGPSGDNANFSDLVSYLPPVLEKITVNLECYLEDLEKENLHNAAQV
ncbi:MAG: hypothetical protein KBC94_21680 [Pseudacidovorax sp.]|uniref:hypothetical protein n=1 Tax=Pseudacidovorax sp. TaxID=1934311 RepID=UPI001B71CFBB|nr:hypothetical protein [Pseudacidovorax sp.]MBP6897036.1 hypothetical protein [Pseudacidovorax sp.]